VRDSQSADPAGEKASWDIAILQAAQAAQAAGQLGGGLERLLDKIRQPTIDWRTLLRRFVQEAARSDYSWKLPNPRYCPQGLYLPALKSEQMAAIVIGLDTSGSINHAALAAFGAEIQAIVEDCVPECTFVVACDAKVQGVSEFGPGESICLEARGGGGTDFKPVFDWVSNEGVTPSCLIYLTDLCGEFPANEPEYPVLWVSPQREGAAPFGEIIHMEIPD
jgi:predicted metal-dependent peptidase